MDRMPNYANPFQGIKLGAVMNEERRVEGGRLKTVSSRRKVPVHPHLANVGLFR